MCCRVVVQGVAIGGTVRAARLFPVPDLPRWRRGCRGLDNLFSRLRSCGLPSKSGSPKPPPAKGCMIRLCLIAAFRGLRAEKTCQVCNAIYRQEDIPTMTGVRSALPVGRFPLRFIVTKPMAYFAAVTIGSLRVGYFPMVVCRLAVFRCPSADRCLPMVLFADDGTGRFTVCCGA